MKTTLNADLITIPFLSFPKMCSNTDLQMQNHTHKNECYIRMWYNTGVSEFMLLVCVNMRQRDVKCFQAQLQLSQHLSGLIKS